MEYFLWEGGVGNNPESLVKIGNDIFGVSPNSQVIFTIGGAGVIPTSQIYGIDNHARQIINDASLAGAHMFGGINRKKNQYLLMIESYNKVAYKDSFNASNTEIIPIPLGSGWSIVSVPSNGSASISGGVLLYYPNSNFSGMDYMSYKSNGGEVRNVSINVLSAETQLSWVATGQYCVVDSGSRTGEVGYSFLSEYDNISSSFTGVTKPNIDTDPDYVAPVMNTDICPVGLEYTRIAVLSAEKSSQNILITVETSADINIQARVGQSYSGTLVAETGPVGSGTHTLSLPVSTGEYSLFVLSPTLDYGSLTELTIKNAYIKSARFSDLPSLDKLHLDQSEIPQSHNIVFSSLDISNNPLLNDLSVIHHRIPSINLTANMLLEKVDVSFGLNLTSLTIGNWSSLKELRIHDSLFTSIGYTPAFVDSIISSFDNVAPFPSTGYVLQYGWDNNSGVKPSSSASSEYNSLISKGVSVIGKSPIPDTFYANVYEGDSLSGGKEVWVNMSSTLTVNVTFNIQVQYREGGLVVGFGTGTVVIPAGQTYGIAPTDFIPDPGQTTFGTITSASTR